MATGPKGFKCSEAMEGQGTRDKEGTGRVREDNGGLRRIRESQQRSRKLRGNQGRSKRVRRIQGRSRKVRRIRGMSRRVRGNHGGPGSTSCHCITCLLLDAWVELDPQKERSDDFPRWPQGNYDLSQ